MKISVTMDRGPDRGQSFGSLFEATSSDGSLVVGAGFQNLYNTYERADRHAVQFFVRPADGERTCSVRKLPRPNRLCGTYLYSRDEVVYSTYGGERAWDQNAGRWRDVSGMDAVRHTMRVGNGVLQFGEGEVFFDGRSILSAPERGKYQLFFYANGHLCFYHVHRRGGEYRPYRHDDDGFSKLYACPWTPGPFSPTFSDAWGRRRHVPSGESSPPLGR